MVQGPLGGGPDGLLSDTSMPRSSGLTAALILLGALVGFFLLLVLLG